MPARQMVLDDELGVISLAEASEKEKTRKTQLNPVGVR
jgi:hypothetical protein